MESRRPTSATPASESSSRRSNEGTPHAHGSTHGVRSADGTSTTTGSTTTGSTTTGSTTTGSTTTGSTTTGAATTGAAESRLDPISGEWTIFAPDREQRPEEFIDHGEVINKKLNCPFCPENEKLTPPAVWIGNSGDENRNPKPNTHWTVRVVPNKFPAVSEIAPPRSSERTAGLFDRQPIRGAHEVIIESRNHVQSLSELDLAEIQLVFEAYQDRIRHWRNIPGISFLSLFKNVGRRAGASLRHSHSQLIATDRMPPATKLAIDRMARHRSTTGCCLQCDLIRGELKAEQRVVWNDGSIVAFCPFASRFPMLLRITTVEHRANYEDLGSAMIEAVSRMMFRAVGWLESIRPNTAYNFYLHTRPPGAKDPADSFHWSIDLFPRMTQVAGFEWSSQCMINPVLPEVAAAKYRACVKAEDPREMLA